MFARYVSGLKPNESILRLYQHVLTDVHTDMRKEMGVEISALRKELSQKHVQIRQVEDLLVTDRESTCRYSKILERYETDAHELTLRIKLLETCNRTQIKPKLQYVMSLINNIVMYIRNAPLEVKIKLIGLVFAEKIEFDGNQYRTSTCNKLVELIVNQTNELRGDKKKIGAPKNIGLQFSAQNYTEIEPILADLDRWYEMRFWIPNPGEPVSIQWLRSQGLI